MAIFFDTFEIKSISSGGGQAKIFARGYSSNRLRNQEIQKIADRFDFWDFSLPKNRRISLQGSRASQFSSRLLLRLKNRIFPIHFVIGTGSPGHLHTLNQGVKSEQPCAGSRDDSSGSTSLEQQ